MGAFVIYILEWSACLLAFLLLYKMCFSGTTFHRFNRFYLLGTVVLSALLPLIHIAPSEQMEPMAEACRTVARVDEGTWSNINVDSAVSGNAGSLSVMEKGSIALLALYFLYVLTQMTGWTKSIFKMLRFLYGKRRRRLCRWVWLVEHDAEYGPFSWMNCIVISTHEQGFGRRASMRHELSHIVLLHHIDLLFLMACVIINPICWKVMKEIKLVHEYEADDEVINHYRIQGREYQRLLIMRTVGAEAYALASSFNLNIKKRIIMMKKKQSHWWSLMWIAVTIPFIGFTLMAFSSPKKVLKEAVENSVRIIEQPLNEVVKSDLLSTESTSTAAELPKTELAETIRQPTSEVKPDDVVTGCVCDEGKQPLEDANVVEVDEYGRILAHTMTDKNGKFSLKVTDLKHKIRITYVGCKSKTIDISSKSMDVVLETNTQINNVDVVAKKRVVSNSLPDSLLREQTANGNGITYDMVEKTPVFSGGQMEILNYLNKNLNYPAVAKEMNVEGNIVVRFTVDKTGLVRSPQIIKISSESPLMTDETKKAASNGDEGAVEVLKNYNDAVEAMKEEAIHVVRNMPRWEPGSQNGKRVDTTYTLPISFKLN